jgi:hypothetical protein
MGPEDASLGAVAGGRDRHGLISARQRLCEPVERHHHAQRVLGVDQPTLIGLDGDRRPPALASHQATRPNHSKPPNSR